MRHHSTTKIMFINNIGIQNKYKLKKVLLDKNKFLLINFLFTYYKLKINK